MNRSSSWAWCIKNQGATAKTTVPNQEELSAQPKVSSENFQWFAGNKM